MSDKMPLTGDKEKIMTSFVTYALYVDIIKKYAKRVSTHRQVTFRVFLFVFCMKICNTLLILCYIMNIILKSEYMFFTPTPTPPPNSLPKDLTKSKRECK